MKRSLLFQLGLAMLVLVVAIVATVTASVVTVQVREKAVQLAQEVATKQEEALRVASAKAALPVLAQSEEALLQYCTKSSDIVPFLERLEKQGRAAGVAVEVLSVSPEQGAQNRIALSLTMSGSFDAVVRSIGTIEYSPYDSVVKTVALDSGTETDTKTPTWTAAVVLSLGTDQPQKK